MEKKCCIENCRTNSEKNVKKAVFYNFPKLEGQRKAWEKAINVKGFKSDNATVLCSRHFLKIHFRAVRGRSVLKKSAVPSLELNPKPRKAAPTQPKEQLAETKSGVAKPPGRKTKQKQTVKTSEKKPKQSQLKKKPKQSQPRVLCIAKEMKETEKKNLAKCLVCQEPVAFMYEFLTNAHAHRAYSWKTFICGHCLSEFDSFSDLMSHITSIGSAKKYTPDQSQLAPVPIVAPCREYPCSLCSAVFKTATAKLYHEVTHTAANKEDMCKQLKLNVKYLNAESPPVKPQTSGRRRKILAADPSEICLGELQEKKKPQSPLREEETHKKDGSGPKQPQKKLCKANTPTGRKQLNTLSSLSPQKKQELVSIVYCNRCEQKFMSLKLLDKHYWSQHPNMDIPLDLTFEVGSGDVTPRLTPCSVCAKRTACVKAIQQLLDEAVSDLETVH